MGEMLGQNKILSCWFYWRTWRRRRAPPSAAFPEPGSRAVPPDPGTELVSLRRSVPRCPLCFSARPKLFQTVFSSNLPASDVSRRAQICLHHVLLSRRGRSVKAKFAAVCLERVSAAPTAAGCAGRPLRLRGRRRRNGGRKARGDTGKRRGGEELGLRAGGGSSGPGGCGCFAPEGSNNSDEMGWLVLETAARKGASRTAKRTSGTNLPAIIG